MFTANPIGAQYSIRSNFQRTSKHWAKVPSQAVSDMLTEEFKKIEKEEKKKQKKKKA